VTKFLKELSEARSRLCECECVCVSARNDESRNKIIYL